MTINHNVLYALILKRVRAINVKFPSPVVTLNSFQDLNIMIDTDL